MSRHRAGERRRRLIAVAAALLLAAGCATQAPQRPPPTQAVQATAEIPRDQLLDVAVVVFDPGLPPPGEPMPEAVFPELREAEARYLAIRLKDTLESTGHWGAVRVVPGDQGFADLRVTGSIVLSTGSRLVVDVRAVDASGREWLEKRYRVEADPLSYQAPETRLGEPFDSFYNEVANDLVSARQKKKRADLIAVRQLTRLQFAADLSPEPFAAYVKTDAKGRISARRLPARDDPMLARIDQIRASENLFVDTLDQSFAVFADRMQGPYDSWRKYTYDEEQAYRALKRKALTQKILGGLAILGAVLADPGSSGAAVVRDVAVIGGLAAIQAGIATSQEAKIHAEAIRELAASVESELDPIVIDVRGKTLRLTGTAEAQYQEWRRLLREIWSEETGLPRDLNRPDGNGPQPPPD